MQSSVEMEAPTIPASFSNLTKLVSKSKETKKVPHKNILCQEIQDWPRPGKDVEDIILSKLSEKLNSLPNIFKPSKDVQVVKEKAQTRSQLEIGTACVFRALERDSLACVLVSGQASPAAAVGHLISLGHDKGCPLLCLDGLSVTVATASQSKCLPLALGFKKPQSENPSDFEDVISLVKANTHVEKHCANDAPVTSKTESRDKTPKGIIESDLWLRTFSAVAQKEILLDISRIFREALVPGTATISASEKKKQKKKMNLKNMFQKSYSHQFEVGKKTTLDILQRGKLAMILVSGEIVPVLASEACSTASSSSLLRVAETKQCPVVHLPGLVETLRSICNGCISVLGLKKQTALDKNAVGHFLPLLNKCFLELEEPVTSTASVQSQTSLPSGISPEGTSQLTTSVSTSGIADEERSEKSEEEDQDYSYLYILKKDSKELAERVAKQGAEANTAKKNQTFSADFISLSGTNESTLIKPSPSKIGKSRKARKKMSTDLGANISLVSQSVSEKQKEIGYVKSGTQTQSVSIASVHNSEKEISSSSETTHVESDSTSSLFCVDRTKAPFVSKVISDFLVTNHKSGNSNQGALPTPIKEKEEQMNVDQISQYSDVMGSMKATETVPDFLLPYQTSKKIRKGVKRKALSEEGFISFAYTEANIGTMTCNPQRKKKKKKKK